MTIKNASATVEVIRSNTNNEKNVVIAQKPVEVSESSLDAVKIVKIEDLTK